MSKALIPVDEAQRVANLRLYDVLDSAAEFEFDDITLLASKICQTPISAISLIDDNRQWFKARVGLEAVQTDRDSAFCAHAILGQDFFVVPDAMNDKRFADNPFVTKDPHIRFYAGAPLISAEGFALGTLCVIDRVPRELSPDQTEALKILGRQVVSLLNLRRARAVSLAAEQFARATVDALTAHIAILNDAGTIIAVNRAWMDFAAQNPPVPSVFATGANYLAICDAATGSCAPEARSVANGIRAVLRMEQNEFTLEYACHSQTEQRWFVARVSRFAGEGPIRVVIAHENVTQQRLAEEKLRHVSLHDALTGLPNRVLFADRVDQALRRLKRDPSRHFAVLFIDLDRFKVFNDSMGHAAGDVLLKNIADRLQACLRDTDSLGRTAAVSPGTESSAHDLNGHTVARMGGDEFTLVLDDLKNPFDVILVAKRLLAAISQPVEFAGQQMTTTASIGIVTGAVSYSSSEELLRDADAAMYRAKIDGKARYVLFDSTMHSAAVSRMQMETDLRRAIKREELILHYQPIVLLPSGEVTGFEALVRWGRTDEYGTLTLVSPAEFIAIAEDTGLIIELGEWVLEKACRQMAKWKRDGTCIGTATISINVSGKQLLNDRFITFLQMVLEQTQLDPASVRLEITESVIMDDRSDPMERLAALKKTGVLLSMDDFGTGYSSLSYLHRFPIDVLKLDRSFVKNLQDPYAAAVVKSMVDLAHLLGMVVVAEGIETDEQAGFLESIACDLGQGFFYSRALPVKAVEDYLNGQNQFVRSDTQLRLKNGQSHFISQAV